MLKKVLTEYSLRINRKLMDKLKYVAAYNGRSVNKEIEQLIRSHIEEFEEDNGPIEVVYEDKPDH